MRRKTSNWAGSELEIAMASDMDKESCPGEHVAVNSCAVECRRNMKGNENDVEKRDRVEVAGVCLTVWETKMRSRDK